MKNLSIAAVINKNQVAADVPFLVALEIEVKDPKTGAYVETLRIVNNNEDVTFNGELFTAVPFDMTLSSPDQELSTLSLSIQDQTAIIQSYMQQYQGGIGFRVNLILFLASQLDSPPEIDVQFKVTGASASSESYLVSWELGAENPLTRKFPARLQSRDRCRWNYKSAQCGYGGDKPSCDFSLEGANGCQAHDNGARFGGFPGIKVKNV